MSARDRPPARGRLEVAQREDERRQRDKPSVPRKRPLSPSTPSRGANALVNPSPSVAPVAEQPEPGDRTRRPRRPPAARQPGRERPPRAARERPAERNRAQPRHEQRRRSRGLELVQDRLLLGELAADDVAARREQVEDALVVDAVVHARPLTPRLHEPDPAQRSEMLRRSARVEPELRLQARRPSARPPAATRESAPAPDARAHERGSPSPRGPGEHRAARPDHIS